MASPGSRRSSAAGSPRRSRSSGRISPRAIGPSTAAITSASGFSGVDGVFRFRPDGQVERGLAVFEMQAGGPVVIDPAPTSFEPRVF